MTLQELEDKFWEQTFQIFPKRVVWAAVKVYMIGAAVKEILSWKRPDGFR